MKKNSLMNLTYKDILHLLSIVIIFSLLFIAIYSRLKHGSNRLMQPYVFVSSPTVLQGMLATPGEQKGYEEMNIVINDYLKRHPDKNFVNMTGFIHPLYADGLSLTFSDRVINIHPVYMKNWNEVYYVYPNYKQVFDTYINTHHPLLSTTVTMLPKNYEIIYNWNGFEVLAAYKEPNPKQ